MAYKLMIQGTMSSAGKSFIVTALCRMFSDMGYKVAPFKSQNMALNSGVTFDGYEMGRAQIVQAEAARTVPDVRMNPVLLKPNSDIGSQVIVMGKPIGNMPAKEYYEYKKSLLPIIKDAFHSLEEEYDVIIVEGAGSPAEINLKENDIVNMGLAKALDLPVLLVGDIDLGGVFAQLLGTIEWLDDKEKDIIKGFIINKFRGDVNLLLPGIKMLEERTGKEVFGVVPYSKAKIDEEDSVTIDFEKTSEEKHKGDSLQLNSGDDFYIGEKNYINIYVIRLPHLSNYTDFNPLKRVPSVRVKYIGTESIDIAPDLIIIPGTKSTINDLLWMKENRLYDYILEASKSVPIIGICGGYQMLGNRVSDPYEIEGNNSVDGVEGLSLLNISTVIEKEKTLTKTTGTISNQTGFFECLNGKQYEGYEIHAGSTEKTANDESSELNEPYAKNVFGTYIHGIFDSSEVTKALINGLRQRKGLDEIKGSVFDYSDIKDAEYNIAAKALKDAIDVDRLFEIMGINNAK